MFGFVKKFGKYAFLFARNKAHVALYLLVFFLCSICFGSVIFSGFLMSFDMSGSVKELIEGLDQPLILRKKVTDIRETDYYAEHNKVPPSESGGENEMRLSIAESEQIFAICPEAAGFYQATVRRNIVSTSPHSATLCVPFSFAYQSGARDESKPIFETEYSGKPEANSYLFASGETYAALGGELLCGAYPAKEGELALPAYMAYGFLNYGYRAYDPDTGKGGELVQIRDISELIGKQFSMSYRKLTDYDRATNEFAPEKYSEGTTHYYYRSFVVTGVVKSSWTQFERTVLFSREEKKADALLGFFADANSFGKETGYRDEFVSYQKIYVPTTVSKEQKKQLAELVAGSYQNQKTEYFYSMHGLSGNHVGGETFRYGYWTGQDEVPDATAVWRYSRQGYYAERDCYLTIQDSLPSFESYTRRIETLQANWASVLGAVAFFIVVYILVLTFFARVHIGKSRYLIGLFRSLGAPRWKLLLLMALPLFVLTGASALCGIGVTAILFRWMNAATGFPVLYPTWVQPAMLCAALLLFLLLNVALLRFELRKDPMALLRGKE